MEQEICPIHGQVSHNLPNAETGRNIQTRSFVARNLEKYVEKRDKEGETKWGK